MTTKAPLTAYQAALRARMITCASVLAHQRAIAATKQALRARGLRVSNYSHREISLMAVEYAKRNGAALLNDAAETIERWRTEGFFGKRAQAFQNVPLLAPPVARSTRDLLNTLDAIGKAGADFRSLGDPWADTTTPHGRLMLTVLGGLAEFERHLILARTSEGRSRAKARGVRFGRKLKLTKHQREEALARREAGEPLAEIGRSYNVSHSTISRLSA